MLYDKRWDKTEIKSDPFSLESLVAWLETRRENEKYRPWDLSSCLLGQWSKSNGLDKKQILVKSYELGRTEPFLTIASIDGPQGEPHTFGAALNRARDALHCSRASVTLGHSDEG
jgi:hypothetical protein